MSTQNSQDLDLEKYFTDVEVLRDWFEKAIIADKLSKRLLVIWGVGGIGKSSLLRMFRLQCKRAKIAVGLASGDEAKSAVDVLSRWAEDVKANGVTLPTFFKTYEHYRAIQAKVEDQAKATQKKLGDAAVKGAGKVAEVGAAAAVGAAVGSVVPGIGTVAGAIGGMGAEALADYLRGFLTKPDIDLLLDPTKKLTDDFLADVNQAASKQRLVLMLDTYEQMTALDDWTRDVAQRLNENVLLVIAGRAMVNWGRQWSSWLMHAEVHELKPMPKRVMHELIRKYYATMRGGEPNPKQVNAIIEFSGGLPMVVNTAVQLWVKYGVEDFGAVKGEVVREVVARLREGVPPELYPLLETAAALRYFNQEILRAVSGMDDISAGYEELLRFPFVRRRAEGYALHDRVRDMIEENVRTDDPAKYRAAHERAAVYFEVRLQIHQRAGHNLATSSGTRSDLIELLYHQMLLDEKEGFTLSHSLFGSYLRQYQLLLCDEMLALLSSITFHDDEKKLWTEYFEIQLVQTRSSWENGIPALEDLLRKKLSAELETEIRWNLGLSLDYAADRERAIRELTRAYELSEKSGVPDNTIKAKILIRLGALQSAQGNPNLAYEDFQQALNYARENGSHRLLIDVLNELNYFYQRYGRFEDALSVLPEVVELARKDGDEREEGLALARLGELYIAQGDFSERTRETLEMAAYLLYRADDTQSWGWANRNLGSWFMVHRKFDEARSHFEASVDAYRKRKATRGLLRSLVALCECYMELAEFAKIGELFLEIEDLDRQLILSEWRSRWLLLKAHCVRDGHIPEWGKGFDAAFEFYKLALVYALRYNRFLLDEVLAGRPQGTPLRPIIPECLKRGEEGLKMLRALREWWQKGKNDVGAPRPDTISPIPENIALLDAEKIAREREPGDNSPQTSVIERLNQTLKEAKHD